MDTLAAVDLGLIAFGAVCAITLDHRACRRIDDDADAMLVVVGAVLAEETPASREVTYKSAHNLPQQLRATVVQGRR